jgi:hypothetical protein
MAASCILEGLLLLFMVAVESGVISDEVTTNNGVVVDGFEEYVDSSCSAATRED